ncbi:putative nuleotide-utilizing enzyme, moeA [SAR116 cluster alpha proteobacterium HIMB100]|nr:putative nuleotide-utilizing enzyme, moeA [SAR116 cluster alpha proteobacterium HIMB100]
MTNPTAAILVIGDEILSGRTKDKNIGWLAEELTKLGISLCEARVIADIETVIIAHVQELSERYDYLFTSGGIGPTHDDITTQSVAAAFGVPVIRHAEAEARLILHYQDTDIDFNEARQKMADIPDTATLIDNPVSAAPGFKLANVYVMAGVPSILQAMFVTFSHTLTGGVQPTRITVQCATGEGTIATIMGDIAARFDGVSVGSYPWFKPGQFGTAVVLTGLDVDKVDAAAIELETLVKQSGYEARRDLDNSTIA